VLHAWCTQVVFDGLLGRVVQCAYLVLVLGACKAQHVVSACGMLTGHRHLVAATVLSPSLHGSHRRGAMNPWLSKSNSRAHHTMCVYTVLAFWSVTGATRACLP
jgi:hypothetical protein